MNQPEKALPLFTEYLAGQRKQLGAEDPRFTSGLAQVGNDLLIHKQFVEAEKVLRESLAIRDKNSPDDWRTFNTRSLVGAALLGQKKYAEAEPLLIQGYEGIKQREASIPAEVRKTRLIEAIDRIVRLYDGWDRKDMAEAWRQKLNAAKRE